MTTSQLTAEKPTAEPEGTEAVSPETTEMVAVAGAFFALLLPHAYRPVASAAPAPAASPALVALPQPTAPAEPSLAPAPHSPASLGGIPVPVLEEPASVEAPSATPVSAPAGIPVPVLSPVAQDRPAPRTMAMLTEIGFLDD